MFSASGTVIAVLSILLCAPSAIAASLERSISTSRQFIVYGGDIQLRGLICDLAERTKLNLLRTIDQRDEWIVPIVISLQYPKANLPETPRSELSFAQTGFGLKLQLNLQIELNVRRSEVRRELLRGILLEMMYRRRTDLPVGTTYLPPPDWLLDGVPMQDDCESAKLSLAGIFSVANRILRLQEFLRLQEGSDLDGPSRILFSGYAVALVELLTQSPQGRARLARFIADLPFNSMDPMAKLGAHFPILNDIASAENIWKSHIERLARSRPMQFLSVEETEKCLDEHLLLTIQSEGRKKKFHIDEFPKFIRSPTARTAFVQLCRDINLLASRAHPICRPTVSAYARIGAKFARGKTTGMAEQLTRLRVSRVAITARARKVNDYMNWFEATQASQPSGVFNETSKGREKRPRAEHRRHDRISVYLDVLETQFEE